MPVFGLAVKENLARKQITICQSAISQAQLPRERNRATLTELSESYRDAR